MDHRQYSLTPSKLMKQGDGHPNDCTVDRVLRAHTIGENKLFIWSTCTFIMAEN